MDNVLITGGTGYVGKQMKRMAPKHRAYMFLSRQEYQELLWFYEPSEIKYIAHLAPIDPSRVLELSKEKKSRLLYCSSGAAYDQDTEYANNKRRWEKACLGAGVDVVIARLFTFAYSAKSYIAFMEAAKANEPIIITGDGSTTRSYMSGTELGEWMWAILLRGQTGEIYDVGSDQPVTMLELAHQMIEKFNSKSEIIIQGGVDPAPYYMPRDVEKTRKLLTGV